MVKYDPSGVVQWATPIVAAAGMAYYTGARVDASGSVYAAGFVEGNGLFDFGGKSSAFNGAYNSSGSAANAVIVKLDTSGVVQSVATVISAAGPSAFNAVGTDATGNAFAVGYASGNGTFDFGGGSSSFAGAYNGQNAVLVRYSK